MLREGDAILRRDLPRKTEMVVKVQLSPLQARLYSAYLRATSQQRQLFRDRIALNELCDMPAAFRAWLEDSVVAQPKAQTPPPPPAARTWQGVVTAARGQQHQVHQQPQQGPQQQQQMQQPPASAATSLRTMMMARELPQALVERAVGIAAKLRAAHPELGAEAVWGESLRRLQRLLAAEAGQAQRKVAVSGADVFEQLWLAEKSKASALKVGEVLQALAAHQASGAAGGEGAAPPPGRQEQQQQQEEGERGGGGELAATTPGQPQQQGGGGGAEGGGAAVGGASSKRKKKKRQLAPEGLARKLLQIIAVSRGRAGQARLARRGVASARGGALHGRAARRSRRATPAASPDAAAAAGGRVCRREPGV